LLVAQMASANAQQVSDTTFQRLISSPDDPVLNRRFAVEAEARGAIAKSW